MATSSIRLFGLAAASAAALLATGCATGVRESAGKSATPGEISIPGTGIFPESLTSGADGSIYIGSVGKAQVYRVAPGGKVAAPFIAPGTGGLKQAFGVLADSGTDTLWVCSNDLGGGAPGAAPPGVSALHSFALRTGVPKASYPLPAGGFCNDIAVAPSGDVYASDTNGMQVLKLAQGTNTLAAWSPKGAFGPPGGVLDGIAIVNGRVIVNTLLTSKLFAVTIAKDGKAGAVQELKLSAPLTRPDGMRAHGRNGVLSTDGTGKIQHVIINGAAAMVTTVKDGLDGVVAVTVVGKTAYALEGQLAIMMGPPGATPPAEKPYRAVGFQLP